jgi:hypothetical protein
MTRGDCCCCMLMWDTATFENGDPTTEELVCSAVSKEKVCNSCAMCISHTVSHGTTQPSIHLYMVCMATVDHAETFFQRSPQKSSHWVNHESQLPQTAISKILHRHLLMKPYKIQLIQALKLEDVAIRYEFCYEFLGRIENATTCPHSLFLVMRWLFTWMVKWTGIMSQCAQCHHSCYRLLC